MTDFYQSFTKSIERYKEVLDEPNSMINRDAAIKRFEFSFELAWKTTQHFLRDQGTVTRSPKETFRQAFKFGLIKEDDVWMEILEDRNLSIHTYNEELAQELYERLPKYLDRFAYLHKSLGKYLL